MNADAARNKSPTLFFTSFGLRIGVTASDPDVLTRLSARLPATWRHSKAGRVNRLYSLSCDAEAGHIVSAGPSRIDHVDAVDLALDALELDARHYVAEFARRRVFVHAGTVGIDGRAVVIPGRSGTGKSTLVAALVRRGAIYYSDEYAVFDQRGQVGSFPKPLLLRAEDGSKVAGGHDPSATKRRPPLPLGAVLYGRFMGSETTWQPRSESAGQGMMALLDNTVAVRRQPERSLAFLQRALPGALVVVSPRGDADVAADAIQRHLERVWG